jgi:Lon protease-like protein
VELPIFALNAVLFPGGTLPLHIFEERYRIMIGECIAADREFGVCLIKSGKEAGGPAEIHTIGTTARITSAQRLEDGRMNILCVGGRRFSVTEMLESSPYPLARVELIETSDSDDARTAELAARARELFDQYMQLTLAISNQWSRTINTPEDGAELSDYIAGRLAVSTATRQRFLEEQSAEERLEMVSRVLDGLIRRLGRRARIARANRWQTLAALN